MSWKKVKEHENLQQVTWIYEHKGIIKYERVPTHFEPCHICGHNWINTKLQKTCIFCQNEIEPKQEQHPDKISITL